MYVSEKTKEALRKYEGQSIVLDAKEVYQPINPGDGLIGKFKILKILSTKDQWQPVGLSLTVTPQFQNGSSKFVIEIGNSGRANAQVSMGALALTLLGLKQQNMFSPSDGKSDAWLTRQPLKFPSFVEDMIPASQRSTKTHRIMQKDGEEYYFNVEEKLSDSIEIKPQERKSIALSFHLPKGEYDFLCGYSGGVHESKGLASNRVSFDVDEEGRALEVIRRPHPQGEPKTRFKRNIW